MRKRHLSSPLIPTSLSGAARSRRAALIFAAAHLQIEAVLNKPGLR